MIFVGKLKIFENSDIKVHIEAIFKHHAPPKYTVTAVLSTVVSLAMHCKKYIFTYSKVFLTQILLQCCDEATGGTTQGEISIS